MSVTALNQARVVPGMQGRALTMPPSSPGLSSQPQVYTSAPPMPQQVYATGPRPQMVAGPQYYSPAPYGQDQGEQDNYNLFDAGRDVAGSVAPVVATAGSVTNNYVVKPVGGAVYAVGSGIGSGISGMSSAMLAPPAPPRSDYDLVDLANDYVVAPVSYVDRQSDRAYNSTSRVAGTTIGTSLLMPWGYHLGAGLLYLGKCVTSLVGVGPSKGGDSGEYSYSEQFGQYGGQPGQFGQMQMAPPPQSRFVQPAPMMSAQTIDMRPGSMAMGQNLQPHFITPTSSFVKPAAVPSTILTEGPVTTMKATSPIQTQASIPRTSSFATAGTVPKSVTTVPPPRLTYPTYN